MQKVKVNNILLALHRTVQQLCFQCEEIVHVHEVYFKLLQSEDEQT